MKRLRRIGAWLNRHWRTLLLALASLLVGLCLLQPRWTLPRHVHRYQVVFDITQSMNTQDYRVSGLPQDRLGYAKAALKQALHELPCGSEVGLGLFTTQTVHFLFEPLEICGHFAVIDDVLEHIDWRMAWSADTHVEMGLYHALREMEKRDPGVRLVFITDGQETPPQTVQPRFDGKPGAVAGAIIGVGGLAPVTVPRYDRENQLLGVWENADIEKPPVSTTVYSEKVVTRVLPAEGPYLSWLDEPHLRAIAAVTGLTYQRLDAVEPFVDFLTSPGLAELRPVPTQAAPYLAGLALLLLLLAHAIEPARAKMRRAPS